MANPNSFSSFDVPPYLLEGAAQYASMPQSQSEKKMVAVDINEFVRTRDAVSFDSTRAKRAARMS